MAGVKRLAGLDSILSKTKDLKVVGATYELRTGKVKVFDREAVS
jgi:hypothetical protein